MKTTKLHSGAVHTNLLPLMEELLDAGFSLYIRDNRGCYDDGSVTTYFYAVLNDGIAYVEYNKFLGYIMDTVHKPCKEFGFDSKKINLVPEFAEHMKVNRYRNWEEYIKINNLCKYVQVIKD